MAKTGVTRPAPGPSPAGGGRPPRAGENAGETRFHAVTGPRRGTGAAAAAPRRARYV